MSDLDSTRAILEAINSLSSRMRQLEASEPAILHVGSGAPGYVAAEGVFYWDFVSDNLWVNDSGLATWQLIAGGGGLVPHDHTTVAQGDTSKAEVLVWLGW